MRAQAALKFSTEANHTGAPPDVATGLELLAALPPLWSVGPETWRLTLAYVRDFAERWDGPARAVGWSDLGLYGIHRSAPAARLSAMGAAWIAARSAHTVISIEAGGAIVLATRTGRRLRVYKTSLDPGAVLPWLA
jgi:hypothetical protein